MIKKILLIVFILVFVGVGYYAYQLFVVPKLVKLPIPSKIPFFSVDYLYSLQPTSPTSLSFGSEKVAASDLGNTIKKDMVDIKTAGFQGVKIRFYFKTNNYISDRIALKAAQENLYPIGLLIGHTSKPKDRAFNEQEMSEWQSFVRAAVSKNKNTIYFWEIWNEPGLDVFRYGSPEEFVALLKTTSTIIKQENPNAKIIVTLDAEAGGKSSDFTDKVLSLGGGNYFDILSFHPYSANPYIREDAYKAAIVQEKQLVAKYGNRWPLIISEIGQPASEVSEQEQAGLGKMVYEEAIKENIPLIWFYYSDRRLSEEAVLGDGKYWGLIRSDGSLRPIYETIKGLIKNSSR